MAKWGEGDKRWLVEEREDGTNVNNWHWKETDVLPWAKNRLTELLLAPPASPLATTLVAVPSVTGDCVMNQRKGKLIPSYELQVHITWTRDGASGTIDLPYLADENAEDEPDLKVVVSTPRLPRRRRRPEAPGPRRGEGPRHRRGTDMGDRDGGGGRNRCQGRWRCTLHRDDESQHQHQHHPPEPQALLHDEADDDNHDDNKES